MDFNKLYEDLQPYIISVYKGGSRRIPFLTNNHDYDYEIYVRPDMPKNFAPKIFKDRTRGEDIYVRRDGDNVEIGFWSWSLKYGEPIVGENIFENFDFFAIKDRWLEVAYQIFTKYKFFDDKYGGTIKRWYHILSGLYVLENGCYDFTEKQIAKIQLLHDRQGTQEIYEEIQELLKKYCC